LLSFLRQGNGLCISSVVTFDLFTSKATIIQCKISKHDSKDSSSLKLFNKIHNENWQPPCFGMKVL